MKILHITPAYYPATYWGGPIFSVYSLNNALARLPGVDLKVLTTDSAGPRLSERLDISALDETLYPDQEMTFTRRVAGACVSVGLLKRLPALIRWADVVHLTATYSFPTIPTLMACHLYDKPLVWSLRGAILDDDAWKCLRKARLKRVWQRVCDTLICRGRVLLHVTSEEEKAASLARIPKADAAIVKNGVDVPGELPERDWLPNGTLRVLFMGRLTPKKGIENLLDAMKILEGDDSISLRICGAGDERYADTLKERARALGLLGKTVDFAGHVDGDAKRAALIHADVCVVPSFSENFCIVVAEALARGLPVIASRKIPWGEVESRQCGLWVANDPDCLATAIRKIRGMDLPAMGRNGWEWMKDEFGWDLIAEEMLEVYRGLL